MNEEELYNYLLLQVSPDKKIDIDKVSRTINNIYRHLPKRDADLHYNMIGKLIIHHKNVTENIQSNKFPYDCKIIHGNMGILPAMEDLPVLLQIIIALYVEKYSF